MVERGYRKMDHPLPTRVYVVSDSVGETGESVVRAAAMQFHPVPVEIVRAPFIHDIEGIDKVINAIRIHGGIVVLPWSYRNCVTILLPKQKSTAFRILIF